MECIISLECGRSADFRVIHRQGVETSFGPVSGGFQHLAIPDSRVLW